MRFLGTDSESQVGLERCSQEYTYKEVRKAGLGRTKTKPSEAQADSTGSSGAGMALQICPQLKAGFASLHRPVTGCSSRAVPGSWGQFPVSCEPSVAHVASTSGDGTSDLKEGSRKNSTILPTKRVFHRSKHHQARFQTIEILIQTCKTSDTLEGCLANEKEASIEQERISIFF